MANEFRSARVVARERRSGTPQIRGVTTNIGGMIGRTTRGRVARAVRCTSFPMFERIYGTYDINCPVVQQAAAFFKNGGSVLYFNRVQGSSSGSNTAAAVTLSTAGAATYGTLSSGASAFPAVLANGDTFSGKVNGGGAVVLTITAGRAVRTGAAAAYGAGAGGDSISIAITGVLGGATQVIDLSTAGASQASYMALINASLIGGSAVDSAGQIRIQTDQMGTGAAGSIIALGGAAAAKTGLAVGAFTAGTGTVANVAAVTAAEFAALATAAFTGSTVTATSSTAVSWVTATSGAGGSVQFDTGTGVAKITGFDNAVHSGAASSSQPFATYTAVGPGPSYNSLAVLVASSDAQLATTIPATISSGSVTEARLGSTTTARLLPGDTIKMYCSGTATTARGIVKYVQGDKVVFNAAVTLSGNLTTATTITLETFSVTFLDNTVPVGSPFAGLRLSSLSSRKYHVSVLNVDDEEYVATVADLAATGSNLDLRPTNTLSAGDAFSGGAEATVFADLDYIGTVSAGTGLYSFDQKRDVRLLAIPTVTGTTTGAVQKALIEYCETKKRLVAVVAPPQGTSVTAAQTWQASTLGSASYAAMYYPYVKAVSALSGLEEVMSCEGFVMGMIARSDQERGVQKAPAGEDTGRLRGTTGVERLLSEDDRDALYDTNNINPIDNIEGIGQCVMGARTLEKGTDYEPLQVRRTMIYLRESLVQGTRFTLFEEQTPALWAKTDRAISSFLEKEWRAGTLTGEEVDDAYVVLCDSTNNSTRNRITNTSVEVSIPQAVEGLLIDIGQKAA